MGKKDLPEMSGLKPYLNLLPSPKGYRRENIYFRTAVLHKLIWLAGSSRTLYSQSQAGIPHLDGSIALQSSGVLRPSSRASKQQGCTMKYDSQERRDPTSFCDGREESDAEANTTHDTGAEDIQVKSSINHYQENTQLETSGNKNCNT